MSFTPFRRFCASSFSLFQRSMMQQQELPVTETLDDQRFQEAFEESGVDFGTEKDAIYTPAITLWALVSQVFFGKEHRSCQAAVARIASLWAALGRRICATNTGAYCRARLKIPFAVVRRIARRLARDAEAAIDQEASPSKEAEVSLAPPGVAAVKSQPVAGRILLVDGFTVTAADTEENQAEYPQNPSQAEGLGFPILRCVSLISLATGLLVDLACGPYSGKESGETALLRELLDELRPGDIVVADCYYCTYWVIAACLARGAHLVMKNHHKRADHPADARRLGAGERLVTWERPQRPDWMSPDEYEQMPATVSIRLVDVQVTQRGFRPQSFTVATTILDCQTYAREWIASVYQSRWLVEVYQPECISSALLYQLAA